MRRSAAWVATGACQGTPPAKKKIRTPVARMGNNDAARSRGVRYWCTPWLPSNEKITTPSAHEGQERCSVPLLGWPVACALAPMCDEKTRIRMTKTLAGFGQARCVYTRAPFLFSVPSRREAGRRSPPSRTELERGGPLLALVWVKRCAQRRQKRAIRHGRSGTRVCPCKRLRTSSRICVH